MRLALTCAGLLVSAAPSFAAELGALEICRAAIATLMGRSPSIIKVDGVEAQIIYTTYVRPDDGSVWSNRCQIRGSQVAWGTKTGRWRDHQMDEKVYFAQSVDRQNLTITVAYADGSKSEKTFRLNDF